MNKKHLLLVVLIILLFYVSQLTYSQIYDGNNIECITKDLELLLDKRRITLNNFLFNDVNLEKLSEKLMIFEIEPILKEDIEFVRKLKENPTDLAYVCGLSISKVESIKSIKGGLKYDVICKIIWTIKYGTKETAQECLYKIRLLNQGDSLYLEKMQPVEDN